MASPILAPAEELRSILKADPVEETPKDTVAPHLHRYIFSPFDDLELTSILARHSGFVVVPKQLIFRCKTVTYMDTNYNAVGLSELVDESESVNQPRNKRFTRTAKIVVEGMLREFGGIGEKRTGVCELASLAGIENDELIIDLQEFFFPQRFDKVELQLAHLEECQQEIERDKMDPPFAKLAAELIQSTETAKLYYEAHLEVSKGSIEDRARPGGFGKSRPSALDLKICSWLDVAPPRQLSRLDLGRKNDQAQTPQNIIVQAATDGLERAQCRACGEMVALIDSKLPRTCRFCGHNPSGVQAAAKPAAAKATKTKRPPVINERLDKTEQVTE